MYCFKTNLNKQQIDITTVKAPTSIFNFTGDLNQDFLQMKFVGCFCAAVSSAKMLHLVSF